MKALDRFSRFFLRFRYPVTLPEDVAKALGIDISNFLTFDEMVCCLTNPSLCPTRLEKFMLREEAEEAFMEAQRKERFQQCSLYSFYFNEGWLEFKLEFDACSRLRRVYVQHQKIESEEGVEIHLLEHAS